MRILLDHIRNTACTTESIELSFNRFYPLGGDHRFIVRHSWNRFLIEIREGKRVVVQKAIVRHPSVIAGRYFNSDPITRPYVIELDPSKEIYPIAELVDNWRQATCSYASLPQQANSLPARKGGYLFLIAYIKVLCYSCIARLSGFLGFGR
jgi:hypothetical protein